MSLLKIAGLRKRFAEGGGVRRTALEMASFALETGEQVAVSGPSGSGKTTLLHLVSGILEIEEGSAKVGGVELSGLSERRRDAFRAANIGYVFQNFYLMEDFSALENVEMGMAFGAGVDRRFAVSLLERIGLGDRLDSRAAALSAGQRQRVAIARALANRPKLALADEPTGSLDERNAAMSLSLIRELCAESGAALLLASHDRIAVGAFKRRLDMEVENQAFSEADAQLAT